MSTGAGWLQNTPVPRDGLSMSPPATGKRPHTQTSEEQDKEALQKNLGTGQRKSSRSGSFFVTKSSAGAFKKQFKLTF